MMAGSTSARISAAPSVDPIMVDFDANIQERLTLLARGRTLQLVPDSAASITQTRAVESLYI